MLWLALPQAIRHLFLIPIVEIIHSDMHFLSLRVRQH